MTRHRANLILLIILCIILFINTFGNKFVWDDQHVIVDNKYVTNLGNPLVYFTAEYWNDYGSAQGTRYLPLRTVSFAIDYAIWKFNHIGYHLTNLLLHIFNVMLVYALVFMLFKDIKIALFSSLLFAAHPMHVESITWIKNRTDLITLIFYLLGVILFIKSNNLTRTIQQKVSSIKYQVSSIKSKVNGTQILLLLGSICCYVLTLMSKEMGITLPAVLLVYLILFFSTSEFKKGLACTIPFWIVCIGYIYFKFFIIKAGSMVEFAKPVLSLFTHTLVVVKTLAYYLMLLVFPFHFNADRRLLKPLSLFEPTVLGSIFMLIIAGILAVMLFRRSRIGFFMLAWIGITLAPVSNIFFIIARPIAEQRLYIPSVGFCVLVGMMLMRIKKIGPVMLIIIISSYSFATIMRNRVWKDSISLWSKTVEASPNGSRAHLNLANAYHRERMYDDAFLEYQEASRLLPNDSDIYSNLGVLYYRKGMKKEAFDNMYIALKFDPNLANAYGNLGYMYFLEGNNDLALEYLTKAITLEKDVSIYHYNLAEVYEKQGDIERAFSEYKLSVRYDPLSVDARNSLALLYIQKKLYNEALKEYEHILEIDQYNEIALKNTAELTRLMHHISKENTVNPDIKIYDLTE
ncbi:MAG: tetratricopeptide repeat protein [bacterium]